MGSDRADAQIVRTGYASLISASAGKCIDIAGQQTGDGAIAVLWPCHQSPNEQWDVQPYGSGFRLYELQSGKCLALNGTGTSAGTSLALHTCTGTSGELWSVSAAGSTTVKFQSLLSNLCIAIAGDSSGDNTLITQQACNSVSAAWTVKGGLMMPTTLTTLQANHSGQCMVFSGNQAGSSITQTSCSGSVGEQWQVIPFASHYLLRAASTGLCLDVYGGGNAPGTQLDPWYCTGADNQLFTLYPVGPGSYLLQVVRSGLCVDVQGASTATGSNVVTAPCALTPDQRWSLGYASVPASWSPLTPLNIIPIAVANLPNGKLMTWSAYDLYSYEADTSDNPSKTYTSIFDPATMTSGPIAITSTGTDMFCPGTANLTDGRVLVNGGSSSRQTTIYDPVANVWTVDAPMNIPRGYEADTLLSNGSVFTLGGSWSGYNSNPFGVRGGEVWKAGSGWTTLSNVQDPVFTGADPKGPFRGDNHMWLFAQSGGKVFHAGPTAAMHWIDTAGQGTVTSAGSRADDAYSMNGNAVMFDIGKILKAGGAPAYDNGTATTASYTIDVTTPSAVNVTKVAPMTYPRAFASGVALPTGQVLIVGGQTLSVAFTDTNAILVPEIWDPATKVYQQLAPMQTPRTYHSSAILLPDARVFVGGGGQNGPYTNVNHFNTEVLTPPYLLNADGSAATRPKITSAPASAALGSGINVTTDTPVASFVLMRMSSITHTVNNDQRRIPLYANYSRNTTYNLGIPADAGVVLPGFYMLFALNGNDVPSVAATIQIQ